MYLPLHVRHTHLAERILTRVLQDAPPPRVSMEIADMLRLLNILRMLIKSQATRTAMQVLNSQKHSWRIPGDIKKAEYCTERVIRSFHSRGTPQFSEQKEVILAWRACTGTRRASCSLDSELATNLTFLLIVKTTRKVLINKAYSVFEAISTFF